MSTATALFTLLKANPTQVQMLGVQQVLALCGNGKLTDGSPCSTEFRQYLAVANSDSLLSYMRECLDASFDKSGIVLQDVVNEFGRRLGYTAESGLYQGKSNAIGFDGVWRDTDEYAFVVEVKTTDTYRINLDTIAGYRDHLIAQGRISNESSVLIVVGRQDTGDLEAQVRGSKHAWIIRIISADALSKLVKLKENSEAAVATKIHELLIPFEYTRLDRIIDIAFTVAEDASSATEPQPEHIPNAATSSEQRKQQHTATEVINELRTRVVAALSAKHTPLVKNSRALYWSADKSIRAAVTVSKLYDDGGYWYAYHDSWDRFLSEAKAGFYVLACVDRDDAFALPFEWIHARLNSLSITERDGDRHWHVLLYPTAGGGLSLYRSSGENEPVDAFRIALL